MITERNTRVLHPCQSRIEQIAKLTKNIHVSMIARSTFTRKLPPMTSYHSIVNYNCGYERI